MNTRMLALGVMAMFTANAAQAAVYFDSINPPSFNGSDGPSDASYVLAQSFAVPGTPDFTSVTLALTADVPSDGGSTMVFLVPDDGSAYANGVPGFPQLGSDFLSFAGATLLGTVDDSQLNITGSTPSLVTLAVSSAALASVTANTNDNEYWIGLVPDDASSVEWVLSVDDSGTGVAGQAYFNDNGNFFGATFDTSLGAYEMTVASAPAPEPASLILLGAGLAGLGWVRRRGAVRL